MFGFQSTILSVAENDGQLQICVQIFSQGVLSQALSVLMSTANGTATGKEEQKIVISMYHNYHGINTLILSSNGLHCFC